MRSGAERVRRRAEEGWYGVKFRIMMKEVAKGGVLILGFDRYLERPRRRSTRTVIVIVTVMAIRAVTPMLSKSIRGLLFA